MKKGIVKALTLALGISIGTISLLGPVEAADRRPDTSRLSIMTFNTEFMWDGIQPEEGTATFPWKGSPDEALEHMKQIAEVIKRNNPDIVNLVEVENEDAVKLLRDTFLSDRGYEIKFIQGKDSSTGQDLALLTRIDPVEFNRIGSSAKHPGARRITKTVSKNHYAKFDINGQKFSLIGVHFLAFPDAENRREERETQALAIRDLAVDLDNQGYPPIVLGDFNDYDEEVMDIRKDEPVTIVLKTIKGMSRNDSSDDLINAASWVPTPLRYTSWYDKKKDGKVDPLNELTAIDHILISKKLKHKVNYVYVDHKHDVTTVSDHYPVVAILDVPGQNSNRPLRISSLLPNPEGDEKQNESVTLLKLAPGNVDLTGWKLRDQVGKEWNLTGALSTEKQTIKRNGQPMWLNNRGDTIELISPAGQIIDSVSYEATNEGEEIVTVE